MPSFSYGDSAHLKYFDKKLQCYHQIFIIQKMPNINIMTPSSLIKRILMNVSRICVEDNFCSNSKFSVFELLCTLMQLIPP